jgi:hypothetical protein
MAIEERTADDWRDLLLDELAARQDALRLHFDYYEGDQALPRAPKAAQDAYRRLLRQSRSNWVQLVVDAVAERLSVVGFRFGDTQEDDHDAWLLWQTNRMDADSELAQTDALTSGVSYISVWPDEDSPVGVTIDVEHPYQTIVAYNPDSRRRRVAALKAWPEPDRVRCWLTLPEASYEWVAERPNVDETSAMIRFVNEWELVDEVPNRSGEIPIVELCPWPRTRPLNTGELPGRSEMDGVIDIQDRINTTIFNRLIATEYAAFRQKWATGLVLPSMRDPVSGEPIVDDEGNEVPRSPYDVAVDRLWVAEDPNVRFGEFGESDLAGYMRAQAEDINNLAAITKTPPHYLLGSIINVSGDALKAAETGLVSKVRRRAAHLGEAWEEVMRLAFSALGDTRAAESQVETIWADFETRSEAQRVDALVKMGSLGVPREVLWQRWGASPQEISRWLTLAAQEEQAAAQRQAVALGAVDPYAQLLAAGNVTPPPPAAGGTPPAPPTGIP